MVYLFKLIAENLFDLSVILLVKDVEETINVIWIFFKLSLYSYLLYHITTNHFLSLQLLLSLVTISYHHQ